jgi:hypothetical protein
MTKKPIMRWYCVEYDLNFYLKSLEHETRQDLTRRGICHVSCTKPELIESKVKDEAIKLMNTTEIGKSGSLISISGVYCDPNKTARNFINVFIVRITYMDKEI